MELHHMEVHQELVIVQGTEQIMEIIMQEIIITIQYTDQLLEQRLQIIIHLQDMLQKPKMV